jgi:hypothetical protein
MATKATAVDSVDSAVHIAPSVLAPHQQQQREETIVVAAKAISDRDPSVASSLSLDSREVVPYVAPRKDPSTCHVCELEEEEYPTLLQMGGNFLVGLQTVDRVERLERFLKVAEKSGFEEDELTCLKHVLTSGPKALIDDFNHQDFVATLTKEFKKALLHRESGEASIEDRERAEVLGAKFSKIAATVKKCKVSPIPVVMVIAQAHIGSLLEAQYSTGEVIPRHLHEFPTKAPHTIDVPKYLDVRLSKAITTSLTLVNQFGRNTEVFIGPQADLEMFYHYMGHKGVAKLDTNNSNLYFIYESGPKGHKVVIAGIANHSRLNHVLLQLKFCGVDLERHVGIRGHFREALRKNELELDKALRACPDSHLAFVGNRTIIMNTLAEQLYPREMKGLTGEAAEKQAERLLKAHNHFQTFDIGPGVFKFSYARVKIDGQEKGIIAFRMPNGSLSYAAARALFEHGVKSFVMVGAGGSMHRFSGLGSYQLVTSSDYHGARITIPDGSIMPIHLADMPLVAGTRNITVDSPLEENEAWMEKVAEDEMGCVDVETFHIFKAFDEARQRRGGDQIRIFPGLFISDVVGEHPLEDKITADNAYGELPFLTARTLVQHRVTNLS